MDALRKTLGGPVVGSLAAAIGDTPVLHLSRFGAGLTAPLYAKLEHLSPTGSGKDRLARAALDALASSGRLSSGQALVVPSSGNAAVSLAWLASTRGHAVHAVLPRASSLEFRQLLALYGAKVELTPSELGIAGARERALILARELGACLWDPFADSVGLDGLEPLAREIASFTRSAGLQLGAVVCGVGSGATVAALRRFLPEVSVLAVEASESAVNQGGARGPHKLHGIGVGFASAHLHGLEGIRWAQVSTADAWAAKREVAVKEGLFIGPTTGAVLAAARQEASRSEAPLLCLAMDSGERTFSLEARVP